MGCANSMADGPGGSEFDADAQRCYYDKQTGEEQWNDGGKDEDGPLDDFFEVEDAEGDQFMAVRPWIGQVAEPDNHNEVNTEQPDTTYTLQYVYGYRSEDSRQNVYFNNAGKVTYMTAALGVILDQDSNEQTYFGGGEVDSTAKNVANDENGHTDDIMCIALSGDRTRAVTGQVGRAPVIFTWDTTTGEKCDRFKLPRGSRGVKAVSYSPCGQWVAAVDMSGDHKVHVMKVGEGIQWSEKGDTNLIYDVAFSYAEGSTKFATAGKNHIYFWDANSPGEKKKGIFSGKEMVSMSCCTWDKQDRCFTGGTNSLVYMWSGRQCMATLEGHKGGFICAISYNPDTDQLFSGGKDGTVQCWDASAEEPAAEEMCSFDSLVRAVDNYNGKTVIGLRNGTICVRDEEGNSQDVMVSHSDGEVWGLDINPEDNTVYTTGDDNKIMCWDQEARSCKSVFKVTDDIRKQPKGRGASSTSRLAHSQMARAIAHRGSEFAVGCNDGSVRIFSNEGEEQNCIRDAREWIEVMSYSADRARLAVGSHDNKIRIYDAENGYALLTTCVGHSSYIMALDWSKDGTYIRSNCGAYELLFFTTEDGQQDKAGRSNTTGTDWNTQSVKFGWHVDGIYPKGTDGTHVNGVAGSPDGQLIATGDDYGLVNLFRDPVRTGGIPRCFRGHSEHVVRVMFSSAGEERLFSIGGLDQTLMQWRKA